MNSLNYLIMPCYFGPLASMQSIKQWEGLSPEGTLAISSLYSVTREPSVSTPHSTMATLPLLASFPVSALPGEAQMPRVNSRMWATPPNPHPADSQSLTSSRSCNSLYSQAWKRYQLLFLYSSKFAFYIYFFSDGLAIELTVHKFH